ncbi:MAG: hypothetical protein FVQ78_09990 [Solirubrobacterales bacterium]|nr:hypothetical protein [Solirubrobacterales bacterium]
MKLIEAVEATLQEDKRTRDNKYLWLYMITVLRKLGFSIFIDFNGKMPSPESILKERRDVLHKKNKYSEEYVPEEGVTFEPKEDVNT